VSNYGYKLKDQSWSTKNELKYLTVFYFRMYLIWHIDTYSIKFNYNDDDKTLTQQLTRIQSSAAFKHQFRICSNSYFVISCLWPSGFGVEISFSPEVTITIWNFLSRILWIYLFLFSAQLNLSKCYRLQFDLYFIMKILLLLSWV
jgi:hypothetical protein